MLKSIVAFRDELINLGFVLESYKSNMNNFSLTKGIHSIIIDNDEFEGEVWVFISKRGTYVYRKQVKLDNWLYVRDFVRRYIKLEVKND